MKPAVIIVIAACAGIAGAWSAGCGSTNHTADPGAGADGGGTADSGAAGSCTPCTSDRDCNGALCAELGGASYCTAACPNGDECTSDTSCEPAVTVSGSQEQVCVPRGACASGTGDAGTKPDDAGVAFDGGGGTPTGTIGPNGGSISRLLFAVVGDTRPATYEDLPGYPTAIITKIFSDIEALPARPPFVVSTGDYQFAASGSTSTAGAQLDIYQSARAKYSGVTFPAMGNHECTGSTTSNCGANGTNGITANYKAFMSKMLAPIQKTLPYYVINVNATDNTWTSKFVFIAANAWDSTQATWLATALAVPTTYTFVVRHESAGSNPVAPGVAPSETIMAQHPYTLALVGHSHTYYHGNGSREVTIGNGGAPLTSKTYGFGVFSRRSDGAITVDMIDYQTGLSDSRFHFVVKADGSPTT